MLMFGFILSLLFSRSVATELAVDIVVTVGDVKFYLHKVPPAQSSTSTFLDRAQKIMYMDEQNIILYCRPHCLLKDV
jgi:hypothetical protein